MRSEKLHKLAIAALVLNGIIAAIAFAAPQLIILGYFLLIIPGLILTVAPTVFLYQALLTIPWLIFRHKGNTFGLAIGLALTLAFGLLLPQTLNSQTSAWHAEAAAANAAPRERLTKAQTIALHAPFRNKTPSCGYLCQLLLHNGVASEVLLVTTKTPVPPVSFRLSRDASCPGFAEAKQRLEKDPFQSALSPQAYSEISRAVHFQLAKGLCILAEPAPATTTADLEIHWIKDKVGSKERPLQLLPEPVTSSGIELRTASGWTSREVIPYSRTISTPMTLTPTGGGLDLNGWEWSRSRPQPPPDDPISLLRSLTNFKLDLPPVPTTDQIRDQLDEVLDDPTLTGAAFLITQDYQTDLYRGHEPEDYKRLARLLEDDRMTNFELISNATHKPQGAVLRDPILRRLLRLSASTNRDFEMLQLAASKLPPDAYRAPVPLLDKLLADPQACLRAKLLLPRLADQGPTAAPKLLAILEQLWREDADRRQQQDAIKAASKGLCRLGPDASSVLPALLNLHQRNEANHLTHSFDWLGALVAIGADPADFPAPGNRNQPQYEQQLRKVAKSCASRR